MSSLGRITNSLLSGINENTLALANFNLDFALVKLEAPREFTSIGPALSKQRRENAEEGPTHRVARQLGALFEQLIPSSPELIKAYGTRVSEIIQTPGINPQGSSADGPFETFVGIDATSVWAAATSGPASIGVFLLACLLAREFTDAKISISIWFELISERKREIETGLRNHEIVPASSVLAARQTIAREQLALFDASARAWLQSADRAKISFQKRIMLILKNLPAPVSIGSSTYSKVIGAWKAAMSGLESLLKGVSQEISDGAILLALSAWRLYPDLIVLSTETKRIAFADHLFPAAARVTVGIQSADPSDERGIRWSLTLSHLRYYGDPVKIHNEVSSRVTISELRVIALGSVFSHWRVTSSDAMEATSWVAKFYQNLNISSIERKYRWLQVLISAATLLTQSRGEKRENLRMLLNYGMRRGKVFLGKPDVSIVPFMGLCCPHVLSALTETSEVECGIRYLRNIVRAMDLSPHEAIIVYTIREHGQQTIVLATAVSHCLISTKRTRSGIGKGKDTHSRWLWWPSQIAAASNQNCSTDSRYPSSIEAISQSECIHCLEIRSNPSHDP